MADPPSPMADPPSDRSYRMPGRLGHRPHRAAIVLAGGGARRWGGTDKTAAPLDGRPVLAHVVQGLPPGIPVIVVGPADHTFAAAADPGSVRWTREEPAGGGPLAALAAGVAALPDATEEVVVLAGDRPGGPAAVPRLLAALAAGDADAAIGLDPEGRAQPLLAAYRVATLRARLALPAKHLVGLPMRWLLERVRRVDVAVTTEEAFDLDTPADLEALRARRAGRAGPGGPAAGTRRGEEP